MADIIHLTDAVVKALPAAKEKRSYYRDDKEMGLILQVTRKGKKSYYLQKSFNGMTHMYFLGNSETMTVSAAKTKLNEMKFQLIRSDGQNQSKLETREIKLQELFGKYLEDRKGLKATTLRDYCGMWKNFIAPILGNKKLSSISPQMIKDFHGKVSQTGQYVANRALSLIKALYNYAIQEEFYNGSNPASSVRRNVEEHRNRYLTNDELNRFFSALKRIPDDTMRDILFTLIFTGVRKRNVLSMRWADVDLNGKVWKIPQTKTAKNVTVPLADSLIEILEDRKAVNYGDSPWVFESVESRTGHVVCIEKTWRKLVKQEGLENLRIHDLRHTMGTYLAANGASAATIQRALTHKTFQSTQVYVNLDVEHIRPDINKTVSSMIKLGKI